MISISPSDSSLLRRAWRKARLVPEIALEWLEHPAAPVRVPVLMYHKVGPISHSEWWVATAELAGQLRALKCYGYEPLTLGELMECRAGRRKPPRKPVIVTFDDGYRDILTEVFPLLQRPDTAFKVTVFIPTGRLGGDNQWDDGIDFTREPPAPHLSWEEIAALADSGLVDFQSHGVSHRRLPELSDDEAWIEIAASRRALEARLRRPVEFFSYPFSAGANSRRVHWLLRRAGYRAAVGADEVIEPDCRDRWNIRRLIIRGGTSLTWRSEAAAKFFFGPALLDDPEAPRVDVREVAVSVTGGRISARCILADAVRGVQPTVEVRAMNGVMRIVPLAERALALGAGRQEFAAPTETGADAEARFVLRDAHDCVRAFEGEWMRLQDGAADASRRACTPA